MSTSSFSFEGDASVELEDGYSDALIILLAVVLAVLIAIGLLAVIACIKVNCCGTYQGYNDSEIPTAFAQLQSVWRIVSAFVKLTYVSNINGSESPILKYRISRLPLQKYKEQSTF